MHTSDFDYILPPNQIAQEPAEPRDSSRLFVLNRRTGEITHKRFFEIGEFLRPGDLLVVNESKVFKARLRIKGGEVFLLRSDGRHWIALAKPGRKMKPGMIVTFSDDATCRVVEKKEDGTIVIDFDKSAEDVLAWTDRVGEVPLPPYIKGVVRRASGVATNDALRTTPYYQTMFAKTVGSVAAPTAGFHFTPELIEKLKANGIRFATVTLHVGLGTFRPMKAETLEEHKMHKEWIDVPDETIAAITETKQRGGRVIAVGTTTVRALESLPLRKGELEGVHGFTNIFITPGYRFKIVDALITNFHLPKSTLLVLVSAFAGRELTFSAYPQAIKEGYRFYSFGDAMFIN